MKDFFEFQFLLNERAIAVKFFIRDYGFNALLHSAQVVLSSVLVLNCVIILIARKLIETSKKALKILGQRSAR